MKAIHRPVRLIVQRYATLTSATITIVRKFSAPPLTMSADPLPGITATPAVDQHISHNDKEYTTVKEGLAYILIPAEASKVPQTAPQGGSQAQSVFYNPIQQFNRDLSVLAIKAYGEDVIVRKRLLLEKENQRVSDKKLEKKRKRDEGLGNAPRKAGKVEGSHTVSDMDLEHTTAPDAAIEDLSAGKPDELVPASEGEPQAPLPEDPQIALRKGESEAQSEERKPNIPPKARNPSFTILDALSATGLRALRYASEIPFTTSVTANDLLPTATKMIKLNVEHNNLEEKIKAATGNAITHMYNLVGEKPTDDKGRNIPRWEI